MYSIVAGNGLLIQTKWRKSTLAHGSPACTKAGPRLNPSGLWKETLTKQEKFILHFKISKIKFASYFNKG